MAGILSWNHLDFDYLASNQPIRVGLETSQYDLYVISDYPALNWREEDFETVVGAVKKGAGLLMIGGCVFTVVEGFVWPEVLNLLEHACYAMSGVAFAIGCRRLGRARDAGGGAA